MSKAILKGQGSSPGIAIGPIHFFDSIHPIPHTRIPKKTIETEKKRLRKAFMLAKERLQKEMDRLSWFQDAEQIRILEAYLVFLQDPLFLSFCEEHVETTLINAEWAVELTGQHLSVTLAREDEASSFKRREDIQTLVSKILNQLGEREPQGGLNRAKIEKGILIADFLSPETLAHLHRLNLPGFITRFGGPNSHTMILARSLCIPAVSGVENIREILTPSARIILNGFEGKVILGPTPKELRSHRELLHKHQVLEKLLLEEAKQPAVTRDKKRIRVEANVELPEEVPSVLKYGAEGIGLFRTESLFWNRAKLPSEKKQFQLYSKMVKSLKPHPITFRTLDVSGDLWLHGNQMNPALGLRGIRFSLKEFHLLETQIKALLRASAKGMVSAPMKILLPMVTSIEEIDLFEAVLKKAKKELKKEGVPPLKKIPIGIMIEVPAAGLMSDTLAQRVDFLAIGSNDLIQYTLAMDRTNEQLAEHYSSYHPALLRLLSQIVQNALKSKKPVYLCGELGGDPLFIPVLLGLGVRTFSMNPLSIPRAKKMIRLLSTKECVLWTKKLLQLSRAEEIKKSLNKIRLTLDMPWWPG